MVVMIHEEFLTPDEVAERLKVKPDTVMLWLRQRKLGGYKVGSLWRISLTDYEKFLREGYNIEIEDEKGE